MTYSRPHNFRSDANDKILLFVFLCMNGGKYDFLEIAMSKATPLDLFLFIKFAFEMGGGDNNDQIWLSKTNNSD